MHPSSSVDKRIAPRRPVQFHIRFRLIKSPFGENPEMELHNGNNIMANLSRTGCLLSTKNYLDVKSVIEIEFLLEMFKEHVRAEAEVVRSNNHNFPAQGRYEYGLKFLTMHPHYREILENFFKMLES
jgi:hypothetical protein